MASDSFIIYGDVNVEVTITENLDGTLTFTTSVITEGENATGLIGDINALFFDVADNINVSLLETDGGTDLATAEAVLLEDVFKEESVTKVDSYTNMNGEVVKDSGKFDGGVQFGTQGIGNDDYQSVSFTLSTSDGTALSLADFSLQDFGVRLTSVGVEGGSRDGSLKLGGTSPEFPDNPEPPVEPECDDIYITTEADISAPVMPGAPPLPGDQIVDPETQDAFFSLLYNNDVGSIVTSVGGDSGNVGQVIAGSNGGTIIIYADGTFDFSALNANFENDFAELNDGEAMTTSFVYEVDGLEQTLCVEVNGITGDDGTGGPNG